ncbi:aromatic ring-hydroxylating dioxygenase subunit alpha [Allosediminivita pacifica]|uniref:Vanillate O-demethylase monooxygenase subunit n=1 Tax=Allosediminivita pacifica TaxID=1267769 RepID=A0A2T6AS48_9RHOB|nr:aromatic ring-hydroxylating dioxygenase subunit alpha [Allosediminivita pacifica]PTX46644.1 vanillate O-demethylase monooxygenase subunit [Allosediminivita pacifica]GGB15761.1 (2Fe-2S)-binding protein [Allosediminivita pacifica]
MSIFVKNAWYVAAWSTEIDDQLRRFTILDEHIVMFRKSDGSVAALEDRCPHRHLPLSKGKRIGDTVQCGYHGLTFDGTTGMCTRVPGQTNLPRSAYVTSYAIEERHGIVWIWMGDPETADPSTIFDMPQFTDPNWAVHHGDALHVQSNYLNVAENLVDPAHVSFVHPTTLGNAASENVPVHVQTEGEAIVAWRWIRDAEPIGFFKNFGDFDGNVDRWHYYYLYTPCTAMIDFGSAPAEAAIGEDERDKGVRIFALHFITPVTETYSIDRWMHVRNTALDDPQAEETMDKMFRTAFQEDKEILEAVQAEENRPAKRRPIRIAIDKGPLVYRKRINELLEKERTEDLASDPSPAFVYHD